MSQVLEPLKVFISRRTEDADIAEYLRAQLLEACPDASRLEIYHAEHIAGGDEWKRWIKDKTREANCFVLIFRGPPEKWLTYELARFEDDPAMERVIAIHPPDQRPDWLSEVQCIEASPASLKKLFAEIVVDGTPADIAGDNFARFVPLAPDWDDERLDAMVDGFVDRFGSQEELVYPLMMRIDIAAGRAGSAGDDEPSPSDATGCRVIADDARVTSVGRDNALKLFNRGQADGCSWLDLTEWHRTGGADGGDSPPPPGLAIAWIAEIDRALGEVEGQQNLRQPRRALRSFDGGELYLPVIARSRITRLRDTVEIDSVDIALVAQPRPTAAAGRRFHLLELVERVYSEVIRPVTGRERTDRRLRAAANALTLIRSEHPGESVFDEAADVFRGEGAGVAGQLRALYEHHDTLLGALGDDDATTALDAVDDIESACLAAWKGVVAEYAEFVERTADANR